MPDRALVRFALPAGTAAAGLGLALVLGEWRAVVVVAAAFALGHLVPLRGGEGRLQPLGPAVAAAATLGEIHSIPVILCAGAIGLPAGWLLARARYGEAGAADVLPGEAAGLAAFGMVFAVADLAVSHSGGGAWAHLGILVAAGGAWHLASSVARTGWTDARRRLAWGMLLRTALADWPVYVVLFAAGALYGVASEAMGLWAVALAGLPYAFAHLALVRLAATGETYRQTIRVLGRMPEAGGFATPGHAERTADLAVAMGAEMGLSRPHTRRLEQAALLHDIGRVVLGDPVIASSGGYTTSDLAQWSAAIIGETPSLRPVAEIVAESHRAYRSPGQERDLEVPAAAQVVKIASAYDYAVGGGMEPVDALEVLHRGIAYDYDPEIVAALRRVLQRRSLIGA